VYANRRAAITIALAGLGLAVVAGVLVSTSIARSELEGPALPRSVLWEVTQLEDAVGRVTASLRSFSRYASEEMVREVVASGREAMLSGMRREVRVLFSDLRGFTDFAERSRPEEVVAILNDHFGFLIGMIARHGGFVVDFLGDAVFTVFGAPRPDTDHVQHAVTCAIEMQRARAAQNAQHRAAGGCPGGPGARLGRDPTGAGRPARSGRSVRGREEDRGGGHPALGSAGALERHDAYAFFPAARPRRREAMILLICQRRVHSPARRYDVRRFVNPADDGRGAIDGRIFGLG
jgi:hypothetical protein